MGAGQWRGQTEFCTDLQAQAHRRMQSCCKVAELHSMSRMDFGESQGRSATARRASEASTSGPYACVRRAVASASPARASASSLLPDTSSTSPPEVAGAGWYLAGTRAPKLASLISHLGEQTALEAKIGLGHATRGHKLKQLETSSRMHGWMDGMHLGNMACVRHGLTRR
jgi:hypothetical protein